MKLELVFLLFPSLTESIEKRERKSKRVEQSSFEGVVKEVRRGRLEQSVSSGSIEIEHS